MLNYSRKLVPPRCDQVFVHSWRAIMSFRQASASSRAIHGGYSPLSDGGQHQTVHFCLNVAYVLVLLGRHKTSRPPGYHYLEHFYIFFGAFSKHNVRSSSRVFMTCHSSNLRRLMAKSKRYHRFALETKTFFFSRLGSELRD